MAKQRDEFALRGLVRVVVGAPLALPIAIGWLGVMEAGILCHGPGLFGGPGVLLNGAVKLNNSRDLTQAAKACGQGRG